ncbi:hypothetical protein L484_015824 [Morus notabilis]|uniref:Uncharacterized protein n=1 Tax=Morus notabilis TaxID=981085 RepID=W9RLR1_9ROSA|nr:hypothetical protein L484_015824 [Morus notabilis]
MVEAKELTYVLPSQGQADSEDESKSPPNSPRPNSSTRKHFEFGNKFREKEIITIGDNFLQPSLLVLDNVQLPTVCIELGNYERTERFIVLLERYAKRSSSCRLDVLKRE